MGTARSWQQGSREGVLRADPYPPSSLPAPQLRSGKLAGLRFWRGALGRETLLTHSPATGTAAGGHESSAQGAPRPHQLPLIN